MRIDAYLEGLEVDVDAVYRRRRRAHPGPPGARRAGRRPLGRQRRGLPAPAPLGGRPGAHRRRHATRSAWPSACAASSTPSSSSATTASTCSRSTRAPAAPCRSSPRSPGVPMVELATQVALGARSPTWAGAMGCCHAARWSSRSRRPVFSTTKLRGVDPDARPGHAVDGRGHRPPRGRRRGAREGAPGGLAAAAAARPGRGRGARLDRRPRQAPAAASWPRPSRRWATGSRPPPGRPRRCASWATR